MSHTKNIGNIKYEEYFEASENVSDAPFESTKQ